MKKVLTFVLIISMLMGNVVPAYAQDTTIVSDLEGEETVLLDVGEDAGDPEEEEEGDTSDTGNAVEPEEEEEGDASDAGNAGDPEEEEEGDASDTGEEEDPEEEEGDASDTGEEEDPEEEEGDASDTGNADEPEEEEGDASDTGNADEPEEEEGDASDTENEEDPEEEGDASDTENGDELQEDQSDIEDDTILEDELEEDQEGELTEEEIPEEEDTLSGNSISQNDIPQASMVPMEPKMEQQDQFFRVWYDSKNGLQELGIYPDVPTMKLDMNADRTYYVSLLKDCILKENWDFTGLNVNLQLFDNESETLTGHTISVVEVTAVITVDNILGSGNSNILIGDNACLILKSKNAGTEMRINDVAIQAEGSNPQLILGDVQGQSFVTMDSCVFNNCENLEMELYGKVNWNKQLRANNVGKVLTKSDVTMTPEQCAVTLASLKVDNNSPNEAYIGGGITVTELTVNGKLYCDTLSAANTELKTGTYVCTSDEMTLNNITLYENAGEKAVVLATESIYKLNEEEHTGKIILGGALNFDEKAKDVCIYFDKTASKVVTSKTAPKYSITRPYAAGAKISDGNVLATLDSQGTEKLLSNLSYGVDEDGFVASVVGETKEDGSTVYSVKAVNSKNGIFVYNRTTGEAKSFSEWQYVKQYILDNFNENDLENLANEIEINLNANTSTYYDHDLNYSELQVKKISLNLNGYNLGLKEGQIVAVDEINGKGKLTLNATNFIKPRQSQLTINGAELKPNNTSLVLGKEDAVGSSSIVIKEAGNAISLKNLTVYGKLDWLGDVKKTLTVTNQLLVNSVQPASQQKPALEWLATFGYKVTTKNLDLKAGNMRVAEMVVSNNLTTRTGRTLAVEPGGKLTLKNVSVEADQKDSFYIALYRTMQLTQPDNTETYTFSEKIAKGTVTISGTINKDSQILFPVSFRKMNQWQSMDGTITEELADFDDEELLATVNTATANSFTISPSGNDTEVITRKQGTALRAAHRKVMVFFDDKQLSNSYASLDDAIVSIPKEFLDENKKTCNGTYRFVFLGNSEISKTQALPSYVKEAIFTTLGNETDGYRVCTLNLKGYHLSTAGSILMQGGLEIIGATNGKLSATKGIGIETKKLVALTEEGNTQKITEYHPVGNMLVDVSKAELKIKADEKDLSTYIDGTVTVKNINVDGVGAICMNDLIVKTGEAYFRNDKTTINKLTTEKSKVYVERKTPEKDQVDVVKNTTLNLGTLWVKSAYAQETLGDYTVEVNGILNADTIQLDVGSFQVGEGALVTVQTVKKMKDMVLGTGAEFVCENINQVSGAKAYLGSNSVLYVKNSGVLDTLVLGGKEDNEGNAYLGVGCYEETQTNGSIEVKPVTITINKAPTRNREKQLLKFFVMEEYAKDFKENRQKLVTLNENTTIFNTSSKVTNFPSEYVEVMQVDEANKECHVYQSGTAIKVVGKYITVSAYHVNGAKEELKSFTNWKDAMNYLASHGNIGTTYHVGIYKDNVDIGKMSLPKNVGRLTIEGMVTEKVGEEDKKVPTYLAFSGDVTLASATEFKNVSFSKEEDAKTGAHGIAAGAWELVLDHVTGDFKSLTGTKACKLILNNSNISVFNQMITIGCVELTDSTLYVKGNKKFTIANVALTNSGLWVDGNATITDLTTNSVGNRIASRSLVISGKVLSSENQDVNAKAKEAQIEESTVVTHYVFGETVVKDKYEVKKNALLLTKINTSGVEEAPQSDTVMVTAAKVPASWFVVNRENAFEILQKEDGELTARDLTHKEGNKIVPGAEESKKVVLDLEVGNDNYVTLDSFDSLQKALDEIAAIGNAEGRYRITIKGDDGDAATEYKFTEKKAAAILICAANGVTEKYDTNHNNIVELSYKKNLDIKTNVTFKDIRLCPANDGAVKVNKYTLTLENTVFAGNKKITVSDSNATAKLSLNNQQNKITFATIKQLGTIELLNTDLEVLGEMKAGVLELAESDVVVKGATTVTRLNANRGECVVHGEGAISIKDISVDNSTEAKAQLIMETVAVPTWGTVEGQQLEKITALKSQLTITGKLEVKAEGQNKPLEFRILSKNQDGSIISAIAPENGEQGDSMSAMNAMLASCAPAVLQNGLVIAKAANIGTSDVKVPEDSTCKNIIKKNGELLLTDLESYVTLEYVADNGMQVQSFFETFADVKKEIETLKVKRDYVVSFKEIQVGEEGIPAKAVMNLTMPSAASVQSLTLKGKVYYTGNITFTSQVVLAGVDFVKVEKINQDYTPSDEVLVDDERAYPAIVKVSTGGYNLTLANNTASTFNTPIELNGGNKGILDFNGTGSLVAGGNWLSYPKEESGYATVLQGTVKGFALVKADTNKIQILGYPVYDAKKAAKQENYKGDYKATELQATAMSVVGKGEILVGYNPYGKDTETTDALMEKADKAKITEVNLIGGKLKVMGDGTFTNVVLANKNNPQNLNQPYAPGLTVLGYQFNINGNLTSTAIGAEVTTTYNANYVSVLTVKGNVVLENAENNRITIGVADRGGKYIKLGEEIANEVYYGSCLLTAAKADAKDVIPNSMCLTQGLENEYPGEKDNKGEYSYQGYILKKNGSLIEISYVSGENGKPQAKLIANNEDVNYYASVNDAVAKIESLNDVTTEYVITLLKDVGTSEAYEELKMPKKAAKVTFMSDTGKKYKVYFNKDITLGCNTEFQNVELIAATKNEQSNFSLKAGKYELTLDTTVAEIKEISSTNVLLMKNASQLKVAVKAGLQNVEVYGRESNKICYAPSVAKDITIKGDIRLKDTETKLYLDITGKVFLAEETNIKLTPTKVANIEKASFDSFVIYADADQVEESPQTPNPDVELTVAWDSKSLYRIKPDYNNDVEVKEYQDVAMTKLVGRVVCLDMTEASEYIKNVGNLEKTFAVTLLDHVTDTNVTDNDMYSKLVLPAKDKAEKIVLNGAGFSVKFKENVATNGAVTLQNITLINTQKDFELSNNKNSKGNNPAELVLDRVTLGEKKITNIKGTAKYTKLTIQGTEDKDAEIIVKGNITNIAELKLDYANIIAKVTSASANVNKFVVSHRGAWETFGKTTIGEIELTNLATGTEGIHTYIGTSRASATANPTLTVTGKVKGKAIPIRLYDATDKEYLSEEVVEGKTPYEGQKLLVAKTEAAEKFIAFPNVKKTKGDNDKIIVSNQADGYVFDQDTILAYKDTSNYVMNGDINSMDVELTTTDGLKTYVYTYAEAINIINNINNPKAEYTITLRGNEGNAEYSGEGNQREATYIIKTATTKGVKQYGTLLLPGANKATSLTIKGEPGSKFEIRYTGAIAPKCRLNFENLHLSEGTVKVVKNDGVNVQEFTNSGTITLNLGNASTSIGFASDVTGGYVEAGERDLMTPSYYDGHTIAVKSISGSYGKLILAKGQQLYVKGAATIPYLELEGESAEGFSHALYTCGKVNIKEMKGSGKLKLSTYHGTDIWKKGKTQLQITGEVDSNLSIDFNPHIMINKKTKEYAPLTDMDTWMQDTMITGSKTPQAYQQIAIAPKLASKYLDTDDKITLADSITGGFDKKVKAVKHNGGLYFTQEDYAIELSAVKNSNLSEIIYTGEFLSWEQAVKEIDKLGRTDYRYTMKVKKDLGVDKPLASLPMPSKASAFDIKGDGGIRGVLTTTKTITLKCPTIFQNICLNGVQLKGGKYYDSEFKMNVGNYSFSTYGIALEHTYENKKTYHSTMSIAGGKNGQLTVYIPQKGFKAIKAISGIGTVNIGILDGGNGTFYVPGGITGVNTVTLFMATVNIDCGIKDFSIKNLQSRMASTVHIKAKNISITENCIMENTTLEAGTSVIGDGKIVLGNVSANMMAVNPTIYIKGKVDKAGRSLIEIKGTVDTCTYNYQTQSFVPYETSNPTVLNIALRQSNSDSKYVQLYNGIKLLKATKAPSSVFKPYYDVDSQNKGMGPVMDAYKVYKNGNDVVYGKVKEAGNGIPEARVWIATSGTATANKKYVDYMTLEEAVKGIDSMAIQHSKQDDKGKTVKYYESYTIQLLKDVEIGNETGNLVYKALTLPSKATELTIWGNGKSISFTGNVTLKCNTQLVDVKLIPLKKVKNEKVPSTANFALGNFELKINNSTCGSQGISGVGNITGSSKTGKLTFMPNVEWNVNNITGLYAIEFVKNGNVSTASSVIATGKVTVKDIIYSSNGKVSAKGDIATDTIHVNGNVKAEIQHNVDKNLKINGINVTNKDKTKTIGSVFFNNAGNNPYVKVYLNSDSGKDITEGAQIISGKYLNANDWHFDISGVEKQAYLRNNNLYVGSRVN